MTNFTEKSALVTGSARGQGLAEATMLAKKGAQVMICDVLDEQGNEAALELQSQGYDVRYKHLDVTNVDDWSAAIAEMEQWSGRLDILVNNAGIINRTSIKDTSPEAWHKLLDINITGAFLGIKQAERLLAKNGGGAIINVSSNAAYSAHYDPAYTASKWALRGLTRAAAMEFAQSNIRVNSICPGLVLTDLNATAPHLEPMINMTPLKRAASVDEIANLVLYLASDEASFITGEDIVIDGGFIAGAAYRKVSEEAGMYEDQSSKQ